MSKVSIWNGFSFRWTKNPHRLNKLTLGEKGYTVSIGNAALPRNADEADVKRFHSIADVDQASVLIGSYSVPEFRVECKYIDETHRAPTSKQRRIEVSIADIFNDFSAEQLAEFKVGTVILDGFGLVAQNNPSGWYFGGMGFEVKNLRKSPSVEGNLLFDLEWMLKPGKSPDPINHGNGDWTTDMPCVYNININVKIILIKGDTMVTEKQVISMDTKNNTSFRDSTSFECEGIPAITKFGIELFPDSYIEGGIARYLREIRFSISNVNGKYWEANLHYSNQGTLPKPWDGKLSMKIQTINAQSVALEKHEIVSFPLKTTDPQGVATV